MEKEFTFAYEHYNALHELSPADRALIEEAVKATERAYAPYSHFHVGAAARLKSGRVLTGSNSESEVFPAGLCAERSPTTRSRPSPSPRTPQSANATPADSAVRCWSMWSVANSSRCV